MSVLLLTITRDGRHSDDVDLALSGLGSRVIRLDVDDVSAGRATLTLRSNNAGHDLSLVHNGVQINLADVTAVWFRRPYVFESLIQDAVQRAAAERELRTVLYSMWHFLAHRFWLDPPADVNRAQLKPLQLRLATQAGLQVPATVITNDPDVARSFALGGETVFKPMTAAELEYEDVYKTAFTTLLSDSHLGRLDLVRNQISLFFNDSFGNPMKFESRWWAASYFPAAFRPPRSQTWSIGDDQKSTGWSSIPFSSCPPPLPREFSA